MILTVVKASLFGAVLLAAPVFTLTLVRFWRLRSKTARWLDAGIVVLYWIAVLVGIRYYWR